MNEVMEQAHETIEEHAHHAEPRARGVAILVSVLAAVLAMSEIGGKAAQTAYLTHHVALSNEWAFYQAKNLRAVVRTSEADLLASLPNAQTRRSRLGSRTLRTTPPVCTTTLRAARA